MALTVDLNEGRFRPERHGDLFFCDEYGHEEIKIGTFSDEGEFEPSLWFKADEDPSSLKEAMLEAYWGESEMPEHVEQEDWSEGMLLYMNLPDLEDADLSHLATLHDQGETEIRHRRRYSRASGAVLHGVYLETFESKKVVHLIGAGRDLKTWDLPLEFDVESISWKLLPLLWAPHWPKVEGEEQEDLSAEIIQALFDGELPSAHIFVGRQSMMMDLAEKADSKGFDVDVYPHVNDGQKFMLHIKTKKAAELWLPFQACGAAIAHLPEEDQAWLKENWATLKMDTEIVEPEVAETASSQVELSASEATDDSESTPTDGSASETADAPDMEAFETEPAGINASKAELKAWLNDFWKGWPVDLMV